MWFFSKAQRTQIAEHLRAALPRESLEDAVDALDFMCGLAAAAIQSEKYLASTYRDLSTAVATFGGNGTGIRRRVRRGHTKAQPKAQQLRDLVAIERHTRALHSLLIKPGVAEELGTFAEDVLRIADAASSAAAAARPRPRKGRPALDWRDRLIALTYSIYPTGTARKRVDSHFEQTVAMLLKFLGSTVEHTHGVVIEALKRCPEAPFSPELFSRLRMGGEMSTV